MRKFSVQGLHKQNAVIQIFFLFQHYPIPALEDKHLFFLTPSLPDSASLSYSLPSYIFFRSFVLSLVHSLGCSFVCSFVRSFVRVCVLILSFVRSFIYLACHRKADLSICSVPANLKAVVYHFGVLKGGEKEWEFALQQFNSTNLVSDKRALLYAMAGSQQPWLIER